MTSYTAKHWIIPLLILLTTSFHHVTAQSDDRTYGTYRISPSMAFIVAALVATLFFMAFFSIYIRNCYNTNDASIAANRTARSRRQAAARGLDASVIETFPTFVYSTVKGLKIGKGALECAVCLCEFEDEETLRLIPKCDHVFHPECIDMWLAAHITCPVCRANLSPNPDDPVSQPGELGQTEIDLEAQNNGAELEQERVSAGQADVQVVEPEALNMSRTRGSRSGRPRKFPRSHSTGHSVVQPGENIDRFTLKLPAEIRKQIMTRALERTVSMVVFPTEGSTRRGYRTSGEGSSRGKYKQLERLDQGTNSERFLGRNQSFLVRAKSFLTRVSSSVRSPRVTTNNGEGSSIQSIHIEGGS